MKKEDLQKRFKQFAINVAVLTNSLPVNRINNNYSNQLIRSSSSPGTNYRAACRAKSKADFINKLKIVEEEADESMYFLELLLHFNPKFKENINPLIQESDELLAIIVSSLKTLRGDNNRNS